MEIAIAFLALVVVPAVLASALVTAGRNHWGAQRVPVTSEGGAYRAGATTLVPRGVPEGIAGASIAAFVWAAITMLVLVPAGGLLLMIAGDRQAAPLAVFTVLVIASGIAHAVMLGVAGSALALHRPRAAEIARRVASHGRAHHVVAMIGFGIAALAAGDGAPALVAMLAFPCAIGWGVSSAIESAAARVDASEAQLA